MILYNYQCIDCKHFCEEFAEMSDEGLKMCPKCDTMSLHRAPSSSYSIVGTPTPKFHRK